MSSLEIKEVLREASRRLLGVTDIPQKEAMLLLSHVLKQELSWLVAHENDVVEVDETFFKSLERRAMHEPLEYIIGKASFYGHEFDVDKRVLIPRPETELLVDKVLKLLPEKESLHIVEIGCGSGIISIMLSLLYPSASYSAVDISEDALHVSYKNAEKFGVQSRIDFIHGSYLDNVIKKIDIIVSNPPYIANHEPLAVGLSFEPSLALYGGNRGDEMLKNIIDLFIVRNASLLVCEMGYDQKKAISEYAWLKGYKAEFYKDLAGLDRGFWIKGKE
ncbi:MAG: peptide chain release factor N(5)-glutamine methyltransferase [Sulfurospirillaceae bacterium]|nr:peptide chain release factor N(5)-glutamine methyltransferase [Sulfurospirillaceae bacterium]MDD2825801.1 peptide chain release factor N(5)-glutamine methyltransferase [Sulfurospirillaceae bacterium]